MIKPLMLSQQKGLTLVELMIATALSLTVMIFVTNIMLTSSRTAAQSEGLAQAQENGRFILSWLQMNVRDAGMPYPTDVSKTRIQPFANACAVPSLVPANNADCSVNDNGVTDRLAVQRTFINDVDLKTANSDKDCSGASITGVADGEVITDIYWVELSNDEYGGTLKCATYNKNHQIIGNTQEIANGIEGLQTLYGIAEDLDPRFLSTTNRYVSLDELGNPVDWSRVSAVRIAILTRAFTERATEKKKRSYILLDADPMTFDDGVTRHIQTTTIFLPNER